MTVTAPSKPEFVLAGVILKCLLAGTETANAFSMFENSSDGDSATPVHVHAIEDESIYMLEGEMQVVVAGETRTMGPGEAAFLRRGVPHQLLIVSGKPVRYILVCTPSGFEGFAAEGGRPRIGAELAEPPTAQDIERMKEAAPRFGITLLPGW